MSAITTERVVGEVLSVHPRHGFAVARHSGDTLCIIPASECAKVGALEPGSKISFRLEPGLLRRGVGLALAAE